MNNYCQVWLSCEDGDEASRISKVLLEKRLIACAKQVAINSSFHWNGNIENSDEILLVMDSRDDLFDEIEVEVAKIHSYETFVLQAIPMMKLSKNAQSWMTKELK